MPDVSDKEIIFVFSTPTTIQQAAKELGISTSKLRKRMRKLSIKAHGRSFASGYQIRTADGHLVDSIGEARVDNFLSKVGIDHIVHKKLVGTSCIVDFWLPKYGVGVEYQGVEGIASYDNRIAEKKQIYEHWNIPVVFVTPNTLLNADFIVKITLVMKEYQQRKKETQEVLLS